MRPGREETRDQKVQSMKCRESMSLNPEKFLGANWIPCGSTQHPSELSKRVLDGLDLNGGKVEIEW